MKKIAYFDLPYIIRPPLAFRIRYNNCEMDKYNCDEFINYICSNKPYKIDLRHVLINSNDAALIFKTAAAQNIKELYILNICYKNRNTTYDNDLEVLLLIIKIGYPNRINYCSNVAQSFDYEEYILLLRAVCKFKFRGTIFTNLIPRVSVINLIGDYNDAVFVLRRVLICLRRKKIKCGKFILIKIFKYMCCAARTKFYRGKIKYDVNLMGDEFAICSKYFIKISK